MKKRGKWVLVIIILAIIFFFLYYLIKYENYSSQNKKECLQDSDCIPASCCHSTSVVSKENAPDCSKIFCTAVCSSPLDCGCGKPICAKNKCKIKKISNESWCA